MHLKVLGMLSNTKQVGSLINLVDNRNTDSQVTNLLGMNIKKEFMPSVANTSGTDLSKYKIIQKGQFAYSSMQTGRDETIRIALYPYDEPAIISPAYSVFEVINEDGILPEFIMMWFLRPESDRYGWFISDASVRASLDWERFGEIEIPLPSIAQQRKYVSLYKGLIANQQCYETSIRDLSQVCEMTISRLKRDIKEGDCIGKYVNVVDNRNKDMNVTNVLGMNVRKTFMPSVANTSKTDLSKYKIIKKGQFAYSAMQVGRDETIRVALYPHVDEAIISPAYTVFEITDEDLLNTEFLMMWFYREEFNRYGWFISDSSVRASLEWERFCEIEIPVPTIEEQKAIASFYRILEQRKSINERLKETIRPLCPLLMQGVIKDLKAKDAQAA